MASEGSLDLTRVVVIGTSCSGKTTFSRGLAEQLGVDHVELDALHWLPGWIERDTATFRDLVDHRTAAAAWVVDGNYTKARDILWPKATTIIWLDYAFPRVFWRSMKRSLHRAVTRQPICNGNVESWRVLLSRQSILLWVIKTHRKNRQRYQAVFSDNSFPNSQKIRLTGPGEAKTFLATVATA